jgi:alanine-glyoxylate transaminase/serine-glyoxylate transaminase/serine-pyruvate transaminase
MAGRNFLFVPGPTNVPDRVLRAMAVPMEDHRSPIFPELTRACLAALKPVFKTVSASPILFPIQPSLGGYVRAAWLRGGDSGNPLG